MTGTTVIAITSTRYTCYRALGIIHHRFNPLMDGIKDFIALPKRNGYQALQTTVIHKGQRFEVTIQTPSMYRMGELGVRDPARRGTPGRAADPVASGTGRVARTRRFRRSFPGRSQTHALCPRNGRFHAQRRSDYSAGGRNPGGFCFCRPYGPGSPLHRRGASTAKPHRAFRF